MADTSRGEIETADGARAGPLVALLVASGAVALAMIVGWRLNTVLPAGYVVSVFLVAVLTAAALFGLWTGIATAIASFFAFDYFFVAPTYTFDVADPREVFALGVFLVAAVLTGGLAGRLREVADAARRRADTLALLHDFAGRISATRDPDEIRALAVRRIAACIEGSCILFDRRAIAGGPLEAWPEPVTPSEADWRAVDRVFETGRAEAGGPGRWSFRPLRTADGVDAVIGLAPGTGERFFAAEYEPALSALIDQAATALERARFAEERSMAEETAERERLRSALLSSISHDLRTPLATILGSVTSLRQLGDRMEPADRADLLAAIEEETDRLSRFVADLLAMTRLEAGLDVRRDWIDVGDVVRAGADHLRRVRSDHPLHLDVATTIVPVRGDATLLEQVIFNLADNAAKASAPGEPIDVVVARDGEAMRIDVIDRGRGLAPDEIRRLFVDDRPRAARSMPEAGGGLGLVIARRVAGAMGGTLAAESPSPAGSGTRVTLRLPIETGAEATPPEASKP